MPSILKNKSQQSTIQPSSRAINNTNFRDTWDNEVAESKEQRRKIVRFADPNEEESDDDKTLQPETIQDKILTYLSRYNNRKSKALLVIIVCGVFLLIVSTWYFTDGIKKHGLPGPGNDESEEAAVSRVVTDEEKFKLNNVEVEYIGSRVVLEYVISNYVLDTSIDILLYDSASCSNGGKDITQMGYFNVILIPDNVPIGDGSKNRAIQVLISMNKKLLTTPSHMYNQTNIHNNTTNTTYAGGSVQFCVAFILYDNAEDGTDGSVEGNNNQQKPSPQSNNGLVTTRSKGTRKNDVETVVNLNIHMKDDFKIEPISIRGYSNKGN